MLSAILSSALLLLASFQSVIAQCAAAENESCTTIYGPSSVADVPTSTSESITDVPRTDTSTSTKTHTVTPSATTVTATVTVTSTKTKGTITITNTAAATGAPARREADVPEVANIQRRQSATSYPQSVVCYVKGTIQSCTTTSTTTKTTVTAVASTSTASIITKTKTTTVPKSTVTVT